jgi:hypothetical protein
VRPTIDRNFTIATIVAPSGMRSESEGTEAAPEDEAEVEATAQGEKAAAPAAAAPEKAPAGEKGGKK